MKEKLTKKDTGFAQVKNEVLNDKTLSWKAKGLFAYLYSKPDNWDFSMWRIKEDATDGKESTRLGLRELEDHGYLVRTRQVDGRMHYHVTYKPHSENRNMGKSEHGKIGTVSNKEIITNKDLETNTEGIASDAPSKPRSPREWTNLRRRQLGKEPIQQTQAQRRAFREMARLEPDIRLYRELAREKGYDYLEMPEDANAKIRRQMLAARSKLKQDIPDFYRWIFSDEDSWPEKVNYDPEACITGMMLRAYKNKGKTAKKLF